MPAARADDPGRKPRGNCHHTKRRTLMCSWTTVVQPSFRGRSAHLGVRGAAAPGAAAREIVG